MTILERQRLTIDKLLEENQALKQENKEIKEDIVLIVDKLKTLWNATGIDISNFQKEGKISLSMAMLPKIMKLVNDKSFKETIQAEIKEALPILMKYNYLLEEK